MSNPPWLSVIVPAHNEERRLGATLDTLFRYLHARDYSSEILVVENASADGTADLVRQECIRHPELRLLQTTRLGKGRAVRIGMLHATGEWRFFCDSDLSMPIEELDRFLPPISGDADISIGSREAPGAHRHGEPVLRHVTGRIFTQMVKWFVMGGFEDTQCGFKCFRAAVAEDLFSRQRLNGWSFDVEVLYLARRAGYRIREVPIPWFFRADSRVRLVGDSLHMLMDLARIHWNTRRGLYEKNNSGTASGS
jgi:glycosyltransferase involved in cell wall biosynthesis